jgi:hypothetical protein
MLRHLLDGPAGPESGPIRSLLSDPSPNIEALEALKRLAKARRANPGNVPADLWRVIYFAAIGRAAQAHATISELSSDDLHAGYRWTLARPWLDASVRGLIERVNANHDCSGKREPPHIGF